MIHISKGLDIPISGAPDQDVVDDAPAMDAVAVLGPDYVGLKASMRVQVGDKVKTGQVLFEDKKNPGVCITAPGCGTVTAVNRGARRALLSVVIGLDGDEAVEFRHYNGRQPEELEGEAVRALLRESGLWACFRTRPFSKVPSIDSTPRSIFVTAMDTNPLAPHPRTFLGAYPREFSCGLKVLRTLTEGPVYVCTDHRATLPQGLPKVIVEEFSGPHPAGLAGTHIHFLDPVGPRKTVWYVGYQDVAAIGHLFLTGELLLERLVSLAGPMVRRPRLVRVRLGASLEKLTAGQLFSGESRVVSGSVLSGRAAAGPLAFLGRYHNQVSVVAEGGGREFLGWLAPGLGKFALKPVFLSKFFRRGPFAMTTAKHGSRRAIVPIGSFEAVMPLDIEPTYLLRALAVGDVDQAAALGCLELDEEDVALLTFVDSSKNDFGPMLREVLTTIEKEGL